MPLLTCDFGPSVALWMTDAQRVQVAVPGATDQATRVTMEALARFLDQTVPVDTGALRANRSPVTQDGPGTFSITYDVPYAGVLEYGGYPGVGPKTVALGGADIGEGFVGDGGIYSRQAPYGWVRKALVSVRPQWHVQIQEAVRQTWGHGATATALRGNLADIFGIEII